MSNLFTPEPLRYPSYKGVYYKYLPDTKEWMLYTMTVYEELGIYNRLEYFNEGFRIDECFKIWFETEKKPELRWIPFADWMIQQDWSERLYNSDLTNTQPLKLRVGLYDPLKQHNENNSNQQSII